MVAFSPRKNDDGQQDFESPILAPTASGLDRDDCHCASLLFNRPGLPVRCLPDDALCSPNLNNGNFAQGPCVGGAACAFTVWIKHCVNLNSMVGDGNVVSSAMWLSILAFPISLGLSRVFVSCNRETSKSRRSFTSYLTVILMLVAASLFIWRIGNFANP